MLERNHNIMDRLITTKDELLEAIKSDPVMEYVDHDTENDGELFINLLSGCFGTHKTYVTYCSCLWDVNEACSDERDDVEIGTLNMAYPFRYKHIAIARDMIESAACEWIEHDERLSKPT